ncbi:MAG: hypothetical protein ACRDP6_13305, partial [Actinoallomurus sp.]
MGFSRSDWRLIIITVVVTAVAGTAHYAKLGGAVAPFVISAIALALLASLVGRSVEALGDRLGAGATGVVQSALGNLPELFVVLFALRDKLYAVATATIVGSILANVLLVLGLAFLFGGIKHGRQKFGGEAARTMSVLMALSVAALLVPSLTASLGSTAIKAAAHERSLSIVVSVLLLCLFVASLPASLKRTKVAHEGPAGEAVPAGNGISGEPDEPETGKPETGKPEAGKPEAQAGEEQENEHAWPLAFAIGMLAATGV